MTGLEIIRRLRSDRRGNTYLVRCRGCGLEYHRVGFPRELSQRTGCSSCAQKARRVTEGARPIGTVRATTIGRLGGLARARNLRKAVSRG